MPCPYDKTHVVCPYDKTHVVCPYDKTHVVCPYNKTHAVPVQQNACRVPVRQNACRVPVRQNACRVSVQQNACRVPTTEQFGKPISGSLPTVVRAFKSAVTKYINILRNTPGNKLWQHNYWEHIIRNETELHRICEYIQNNPTRWQEDALHPDQGPFPGETHESVPHYGHEAWMV